MKFITTWSLRPDGHKNATARFLENGGKPPEGIRTIGRWHYADGSGGVHVFECDNAQILRDFAQEWGDLLELHTRPVVEDAEAGAAMAKHSRKS
jgi:hypothetical protein